MLLVQKYGGTSLLDADRIRRAAGRAVQRFKEGHQVVLVVSAQGHTTDELIANAARISPERSGREMDAYLAAGEQMSAALMAMAVEAMGVGAVSLTGFQAGIRTDGVHGDARITHVDTGRIRRELDAGKIVVAAGFQGIDDNGDITTLGRGGSDTTAVALTAWLRGDKCQIFTDVDGVYDRDPGTCSHAVRFDRIGYEPMLTLIDGGAQVLHRVSVELAREHGLVLEVLSAFTGAPGTLVGDLE